MLSLGDYQHNIVIDLIQPVAAMPSRNLVLLSATTDSLFVPLTRLLFGDRAFQVAAPNYLVAFIVSITLTAVFVYKF